MYVRAQMDSRFRGNDGEGLALTRQPHAAALHAQRRHALPLYKLLLRVALLLLAGCGIAAAQSPTIANIEYARVNGQPLRLDLYLPAAPAIGRPLAVFVHGGGWSSGNKDVIQPAMLPLLDAGYALASVDYRLVNTQHANLYGGADAVVFPAAVHDVKAAVRFLRANARVYGFDAGRIALWGTSAGAHLATLVALSDGDAALEGSVGNHTATSSAVQLAIDGYGPTDILRMGPDAALAGFNPAGWDAPDTAHANLIGCGAQGMGAIRANIDNPAPPWPQCVARANLANPVRQIDARDPPVWIGHSNDDQAVPWPQSQRLFDALQGAGIDSAFVRAPTGGHQLGPASWSLARAFLLQRFAAEVPMLRDGFE